MNANQSEENTKWRLFLTNEKLGLVLKPKTHCNEFEVPLRCAEKIRN